MFYEGRCENVQKVSWNFKENLSKPHLTSSFSASNCSFFFSRCNVCNNLMVTLIHQTRRWLLGVGGVEIGRKNRSSVDRRRRERRRNKNRKKWETKRLKSKTDFSRCSDGSTNTHQTHTRKHTHRHLKRRGFDSEVCIVALFLLSRKLQWTGSLQ